MKIQMTNVFAFLAVLPLAIASRGFAHAQWDPAGTTLASGDVFKPRSNNDGLKTGPCGGVARTAKSAKLTGGQPVTLKFVETINHPGGFIIGLSEDGDKTFTELATVAHNPATSTPRNYTVTVTLPNKACTSCTLQLVQKMTDSGADSKYFSCADISIEASSASTSPSSPGTTTGGTPASPGTTTGGKDDDC